MSPEITDDISKITKNITSVEEGGDSNILNAKSNLCSSALIWRYHRYAANLKN